MSRLEVRNLVKIYNRRTVVKNVSFSVHAGELVGLLGRNGAGKTTSFRIAVGMVKPRSGKVLFQGDDVTKMPMFKRARMGLGYLAQEPIIFSRLTVEQNILAVLEPQRMTRREVLYKTERLLAEFGLEHLRRAKAGTCSGGERRRLEIARALATEPSIMLLDEPVDGVDPIAKSEILDLVKSLRQRGIGILITEHDVDHVLPLLDRCYIIHEGIVIFQGTPEEVVEDERVREDYLGNDYVFRPMRVSPSRRLNIPMSERLPQLSLGIGSASDLADLQDRLGRDLETPPPDALPADDVRAEPAAARNSVEDDEESQPARARLLAARADDETDGPLTASAVRIAPEYSRPPSAGGPTVPPVQPPRRTHGVVPGLTSVAAGDSGFGTDGGARLGPASAGPASPGGVREKTQAMVPPPTAPLPRSATRRHQRDGKRVQTRVITKADARARQDTARRAREAAAGTAADTLPQSPSALGTDGVDDATPPPGAPQDTSALAEATQDMPAASSAAPGEPATPPAIPAVEKDDASAAADADHVDAATTTPDFEQALNDVEAARAGRSGQTDSGIRRYGAAGKQIGHDLPADPIAMSPRDKPRHDAGPRRSSPDPP